MSEGALLDEYMKDPGSEEGKGGGGAGLKLDLRIGMLEMTLKDVTDLLEHTAENMPENHNTTASFYFKVVKRAREVLKGEQP